MKVVMSTSEGGSEYLVKVAVSTSEGGNEY